MFETVTEYSQMESAPWWRWLNDESMQNSVDYNHQLFHVNLGGLWIRIYVTRFVLESNGTMSMIPRLVVLCAAGPMGGGPVMMKISTVEPLLTILFTIINIINHLVPHHWSAHEPLCQTLLTSLSTIISHYFSKCRTLQDWSRRFCIHKFPRRITIRIH